MPESIRALLVVLILAVTVFGMAKRPCCALIPCADYKRRRNTWFAVTIVAFLSHNFWIYTGLATIIILHSLKKEPQKGALYFSLLLAAPPSGVPIPGLGIVNYLFDLSHPRLLSLTILFPGFLELLRRRPTHQVSRSAADVVLVIFVFLIIVLYFRGTTLTDTLREGFYAFLGVFLPYYVLSRSVRTRQGFRDVLLCYVVTATIIAVIGILESVSHWLLYASVDRSLGLNSGWFAYYLVRAGLLRAHGSTGQPIVFGYVVTIATGFFLYFEHKISNRKLTWLVFATLVVANLASVSRGTWLGAAVLMLAFIVTGPKATSKLLKVGVIAILVIPFVLLTPAGQQFSNLLPFVGTENTETVTYRQALVGASFKVIERNPIFGSVDWALTPEMEAMRQGQGIIDVVNTYIQVLLRMGIAGLLLFLAFFSIVIQRIRRAVRSLPNNESDLRLLGRVLLATIVSVLFMIFTVSSVSYIPILYWSLGGLGIAYSRLVEAYCSGVEEEISCEKSALAGDQRFAVTSADEH